jgi:hypothetical protein
MADRCEKHPWEIPTKLLGCPGCEVERMGKVAEWAEYQKLARRAAARSWARTVPKRKPSVGD